MEPESSAEAPTGAVVLTIDVLGPLRLQVERPSDGAVDIPLPSQRAEDLLRALAHWPSGVLLEDAATLALRKDVLYDGASQLRSHLSSYGLNVPRADRRRGYYVVDTAGESLKVRSDLHEFRARAEKCLSEFDRVMKRGGADSAPSIRELTDLAATLASPCALWRERDKKHKWLKLLGRGLSDHPDVVLDQQVMDASATVLVALAEAEPTEGNIIRARAAITDRIAAHGGSLRALETRLNKLSDELESEKEDDEFGDTDCFLAVPMAAQPDRYPENQQLARAVAAALKEHCGVRAVFCAADGIDAADAFEEPTVGFRRNSRPFGTARHFVMLWPEKLPSSVLVEAGMALALRLHSIYLVRNRDDLPWLLRDGTDGSTWVGRVTIVTYKNEAQLVKKLKNNGTGLLNNIPAVDAGEDRIKR